MALLGSGLLVTFTEVAPEDEAEFNEWYDREHVDERVFMPGFKRARRYVAADGATNVKYFATYETETVRDLCAPEYMKVLGDQSPWSKKVMGKFTHFDRLTVSATIDLTHGFSGAAGLARLFPSDAAKDALRTELKETLLPEILKREGVHGACVLENDLDVSNEGLKAQGKQIPADQKQEWLVLLDAATPMIARSALEALFGCDRLAERFGVKTIDVNRGAYAFTFGNQR
jgi:hypothetical protein